MKFFSFTQISSSPFQCWACPDDAQDILEPSHQLFSLYSKHHNRLPRNASPNISASIVEIQFGVSAMSCPSASSLTHLHSKMGDTQCEYGHGPCLRHPLGFGHSRCCIFERLNPLCVAGYRLVKHENDTSSPIQGGPSYNLHYGLSYDTRPYCKAKKFIETEVPAMKLQGFNL
jgi:hypothetical protein